MGFCRRCGTKLESDWNVCPECGLRIKASEERRKEKNTPLVVLTASVILLVVLLTVVIVGLYMRKRINIEQYVTIEYSGFNGYATAEVEISEELYDLLSEYRGAADSIEVTLNKTEGISNGDELVATITYDKSLMRETGLHVTGSSISGVVSDLDEGEVYDPFEDLTVTFSGYSPNVLCTIEYTGELEGLTFTPDRETNLSDGETVYVTVTYDEAELYEQGVLIVEDSNSYVISGVDQYLTGADDLKDELMENVISAATEQILSLYAEREEYVTISEPEYAGSYFFINHDDAAKNMAFVIMVASVTAEDGSFTNTPIFLPIEFDNLSIGSDGKINYESMVQTIFGATDYTYKENSIIEGYSEGDKAKMYNELYGVRISEFYASVTNEGLIP